MIKGLGGPRRMYDEKSWKRCGSLSWTISLLLSFLPERKSFTRRICHMFHAQIYFAKKLHTRLMSNDQKNRWSNWQKSSKTTRRNGTFTNTHAQNLQKGTQRKVLWVCYTTSHETNVWKKHWNFWDTNRPYLSQVTNGCCLKTWLTVVQWTGRS